MNHFDDLDKICRLLGFKLEFEFSDPGTDSYIRGCVAKLVMTSDCYTTRHQALEDLERRAVAMLEEVVMANEGRDLTKDIIDKEPEF